jgi:hypothetical protein
MTHFLSHVMTLQFVFYFVIIDCLIGCVHPSYAKAECEPFASITLMQTVELNKSALYPKNV